MLRLFTSTQNIAKHQIPTDPHSNASPNYFCMLHDALGIYKSQRKDSHTELALGNSNPKLHSVTPE